MRTPTAAAIRWSGPELAADPSWVCRADGELERGLGALMEWARSRVDPEEALVAGGWSAPAALQGWCKPLVEQLERGRGVARVTGLQGLREQELRLLFLALGRMLGPPDRTYGLLYEVRDSGQSHLERAIPVSQTRAATGMHTDSSQRWVHPRWVGLACLQPGASGGESAVASVAAVHAHLLGRDPALVERLREPFIRDVVTPGGNRDRDTLRANAFPIFAGAEDQPTLRYMRLWIERGQAEAGLPLGPRALADLDILDAALNAPGHRHDFRLEAGDLLLLDNHRIAHGRAAYNDDPQRPRRLLRLWLNAMG